MIYQVGMFVGGFALLILGADWFIKAGSELAIRWRISKIWLAMIMLSFATSLPEFWVVIEAVHQQAMPLAVGNIIGSYVANLSFAIGIAAVIKPITVHAEVVKKDLPISFFVLALTFLLLADGSMSYADALILLLCLVAWLVWMHRSLSKDMVKFDVSAHALGGGLLKNIVLVVLGLGALHIGALGVVDGAIFLSKHFHIAPAFVGMTAVAIGTSLPEIFASAYASYRQEDELAVGTALGSNLFLLMFALPLAVLMNDFHLSSTGIWREFIFLVILTGAFWLFTAQFDRVLRVNRIEGAFLIFMGVAFYLLQTWMF